MGYLQTFWNYIKTEKGRHDITDYVRAVIIMASVIAMLRILAEFLSGWWNAVKDMM
jgi:chorismate synthase